MCTRAACSAAFFPAVRRVRIVASNRARQAVINPSAVARFIATFDGNEDAYVSLLRGLKAQKAPTTKAGRALDPEDRDALRIASAYLSRMCAPAPPAVASAAKSSLDWLMGLASTCQQLEKHFSAKRHSQDDFLHPFLLSQTPSTSQIVAGIHHIMATVVAARGRLLDEYPTGTAAAPQFALAVADAADQGNRMKRFGPTAIARLLVYWGIEQDFEALSDRLKKTAQRREKTARRGRG